MACDEVSGVCGLLGDMVPAPGSTACAQADSQPSPCRSLADDFTFLCLEMTWGRLLAFVTCSYTFAALLFAVLFWLLVVSSSCIHWCTCCLAASGSSMAVAVAGVGRYLQLCCDWSSICCIKT